LAANIWFVCVSNGGIMPESLDLLSLLTASRAPDGTVGWRAGAPVRYSEFVARTSAWRTLLARTPGHRFALYISDSIEFAAALFGAWQADKAIVLPADTLPVTCATLQQAVDGYLGEFAAQWAPLAPTAADCAIEPGTFKRLAPDFIGLVVHTSGSTGAAQAIPKQLSQLAAEVVTLETLFGGMLGTAGIVATVSHQHIYGLLFKVLWPLAAGRAIHARSFAFPEELAPVLAAHECALVSSPAHLKRLPDLPGWADAAPHLRAVFSSGGPLPLDVSQQAARLLAQVPIEVYGSSETGGIACRQRHPQSDESWTPMPGVAWRIEPDDGVLTVQSAHLPDAGWFRLADRALPAEGGRFLLQGRVDRIVKIEEKRISLDAIESRLIASPLVTDARMLVLEGQRQRIAAFAVLSTEGRKQLAEIGKLAFNRLLRDTLGDAVERVALPRRWRYLDALPVNAQGKTTHAELLALLEDKPARPTLPRQRLLEKEAQRAVFELIAPHDLFYFDGHFPAAPILPGVVQVDWAIAYGRQCFDLPPLFRGIHALKFQNVVRPEMPVTLELLHDPVKSCLTFRLSSPAGQHASGKILFGTPDV
jgi:acyl-coenzyme A synthetase/AMP-(fatty) acid ligase